MPTFPLNYKLCSIKLYSVILWHKLQVLGYKLQETCPGIGDRELPTDFLVTHQNNLEINQIKKLLW